MNQQDSAKLYQCEVLEKVFSLDLTTENSEQTSSVLKVLAELSRDSPTWAPTGRGIFLTLERDAWPPESSSTNPRLHQYRCRVLVEPCTEISTSEDRLLIVITQPLFPFWSVSKRRKSVLQPQTILMCLLPHQILFCLCERSVHS